MFSNSIKILLSICNLKMSHFATYIGYDFSYVSKWINESRLPSLKNNDQLLDKISEFFIESVQEESIIKIENYIKNEINLTGNIKTDLTNYLKTCYEQQNNIKKNKPEIYNSYIDLSNSFNVIDQIKTNSTELWFQKSNEIEIISTINMLDYYNNFDLIHLIKWYISKGKKIHLIQKINFNIIKNNPLILCKFLCELLEFSSYLSFSIIESNNYDDGILMIDRKILLLQLKNNHFKNSIWSLTKETSLINQCLNIIESKNIIHIFNNESMRSDEIIKYFAEPNSKYILTSMQPLYMEIEKITNMGKNMNEELNNLVYEIGVKTSKQVVIFKSAIIDYFTNHQIELYGQDIHLDQDECATHLHYVAQKFKQLKDSNLFILNDINPIFNNIFNQISFYMNENSLYITYKKDNIVQSSINIVYKPFIDCFNELFIPKSW